MAIFIMTFYNGPILVPVSARGHYEQLQVIITVIMKIAMYYPINNEVCGEGDGITKYLFLHQIVCLLIMPHS
jgi:hypothetical protein